MNQLFLSAIETVASARKCLGTGELRPGSKDIQQAWEILHELTRSLPPSLDYDVKLSLESVFAFLRTRLMEAKSQHSVTVLQEVESLLMIVHHGWLDHEAQREGLVAQL